MGPLAVIESRWWSSGNHSVRSLFEAVAAIHYSNPSEFFYDMFADRSSLKTVFSTRAQDGQTEVVYLASHGNQNQIGPTPKTAISRTEFRNIIKSDNSAGQIKGLFLGTCLTGNTDTAKFLLHSSTNLVWVAGYSKSVDWVDGSAIDMVFMSKLAALYRANKSKKKGKLSPRALAHDAATQLVKLIPGAYTQYGFNIYFNDNGAFTSMFH